MENKKRDVPDSCKSEQADYRQSTYPTYPSGWYPLCWSHEVKKGEVIQRNALGKHYAIFRGERNGEIGVLDAFCPHLGSNLVIGGKVCNDTLQCPFHLWKFDKNGQCKDIPYLPKNKKIPNNANAKSYPCIEYHHMVCVYYDNTEISKESGKPKQTIIPLYNLPIQHDLLDTSKYGYVGSIDYGVINMHIQEFAENAADWMHFAPIHGKMMFPFTQIEIPLIHRWLRIHHEPATHIGGGNGKDSVAINEKKYGPDNKHFLYFITESHLKWKGKSIPNSNGIAVITFCGPAGVCIFKMCIPQFDPDAYIVLFHTHLPEDKMNLRVRFHWYAHHKLPRLLVWYVVGNWISQWTNDIAIWENKILLKKPCLVKGDGPIFKVRRWWRQFYPKEEDKEKRKKVAVQSGGVMEKEIIQDNDDGDKNNQEVNEVENKDKDDMVKGNDNTMNW